MKTIYFVTEGRTDQIVLKALVTAWLGDTDFVVRPIQPPESAYADGLHTRLSEGWKGVVAWCAGNLGVVARDEALRAADVLIVHVDADVASDPDFTRPPFSGPCPPAATACNHVREEFRRLFGGELPANAVLCVPSQDTEAWVLSALHPELADKHHPIECRIQPGSLLVQKNPHRLLRSQDGRLRKETARYRTAAAAIAEGWDNCTHGSSPRCTEAVRFEAETRHVLGI